MKILYLHTNIWPSSSPSTSFITYYTHALASAGAEVELIVGSADNTRSPDEVIGEYFGLSPLPALKISAIKLEGENHHHKRNDFYKKASSLVAGYLNEGKIDILITRSLSLLPILLRLRGKNNRPKVVFESHDFFSELRFLNQSKMQDWKNYFREKHFLKKIDALVCLQMTQHNLYKKHYPKLKIIHLPSGCREYHPSKHPFDDFTCLYIGSLDLHKGVGDLLDTWIAWKNPPRLLIVGGREMHDVERIRSFIKVNGKEDIIDVVPWQNPADIPQYLHRANIGILPLRDTLFNRYLTFPLKMLDYMSAGLPIVTVDLPTVNAVLADMRDSIYITAIDLIHLRQAVDRIRHNENFYRYLRDGIARKAEFYSWKHRAEKSLEQFSLLG